ncbi:MAG: DNA sulfur modification protein DndD [Planctomycetota bacterium]|nr:DNA sulfur modification protein DndD [Planctomycetota bacterium]
MILNQITLRNFCLYCGEQVINLAPEKRAGRPAPIVLCGGINGGGKTTLLDAVQLVLYGKRARCSKRGEKPYDDFLRESIHHGAAPSDGAAIQLAFRYASEGHEHLYEVTRSWVDVRGKIRETVQVCRDGEVDGWLSENWNQVVEELIPFGIAQLCFFDAEKIRFLAEDETSTEALGGAIKSLLGLDLVERLVSDTGVLESRLAKRTQKSADMQEVERLESQLQTKQTEIERLVQERGALENPRQAAHQRMTKAEERFARIGGQHWEQRESQQRKLVELELSLQEHEAQLVALAVTELPLMLIPELLNNVVNQADRETQAAEAGIITKLLVGRDKSLLKLLTRKRVDAKAAAVVAEFLTKDRSTREVESAVDPRLQLSDTARRLLGHFLERGFAEKRGIRDDLLRRVENGRRSQEDVQRSLAAVPEEETIREVAEQLTAAAKEVGTLDQQIQRLDRELDTRRNERAGLENQFAKLRRQVVDEEIRGEEDTRLASLLVRTQETMQQFLRRATTSKIDRLSELVTESFRFLLRKKSLVQRVQIDPDTFAIALFDNSGRPISKQRLSEGEKQIFAISVLWGLSRAAGRPLPAIIDTPMARLDSEHRQQLVERYFPNASHQILILSTDTEIERDYFHTLQPHIARAYHLDYDEERRATVAREGYFWEVEEPAYLEEVSS